MKVETHHRVLPVASPLGGEVYFAHTIEGRLWPGLRPFHSESYRSRIRPFEVVVIDRHRNPCKGEAPY
jgi:hypothetical protein